MTGEIIDSVVPGLAEEVDGIDTDEAFFELVCADDDLLRAEFEAIVAASWVGPPDRPTPVPSPRPPGPRPAMVELPPTANLPLMEPEPSGPGDGQRGRERSPPRQ
ncbi:hypothetical protein [Humibacillus xanthopallidus]|uniref:Uncharacterized protein n=1 Tax=Humibacillus xanthopallidus TaxID=412689 RepID=A0A543HA85_9MICO|nr:hypothetical protein [Humibacillus xanthopallidus]TQM55220.1 hypothetical protein FBY41_4548 [Humibacillus xanthopallidus]